MDLSKAFDCTPRDMVIAELAPYGIGRENLRLSYSYVKGRKQCVSINNTYYYHYYYYTNIFLQNEFIDRKYQLHQAQQHDLKQTEK